MTVVSPLNFVYEMEVSSGIYNNEQSDYTVKHNYRLYHIYSLDDPAHTVCTV